MENFFFSFTWIKSSTSHQVLQRLLDHQLYIKDEKCEFHAPTVPFMGFIGVFRVLQIIRHFFPKCMPLPPLRSSSNGLPRLRGNMTWGTGSCRLSSWPWRSGATGWRKPRVHSWFGLIRRTWHTSGPQNAATPDSGLFFIIVLSTLPYHPGLKNIKPDALSRLFDPSSAPISCPIRAL